MTDAGRWRRLETVVQAALERPVGERAAFLIDACGDDEDLRREAASLIAREEHADAFLATPLGALAADALAYSPGGAPVIDEPALSVGARMGSYEIGERLGAGGMGEVYRAHDHALRRDVALKVLPAAFSADRERLARFEREARLLAALNHPHVAAVYGFEGSGDRRAIILELIEGETLEARLRRGPLPVADALTCARQMADALDHAHRRGVTHRDLKPANVMLTPGGAKLLDFGLARWTLHAAGYLRASGDHANRPDDSLTEKGTILGTVHYMAPEQLEGRPVDARTDIFAFGAVLYEMLTGRKAFGGSAPAVMAAVLNTTPAVEVLNTIATPALSRVVGKCLAKDPDDRWQTARDLADELRWIAEESARPAGAAGDWPRDGVAIHRAKGVWWRRAALVTTGAALAGMASGAFVLRAPSVPVVVTRFAIQAFSPVDTFTIAPDGGAIAYTASAQTGERYRLFLRRLDQFDDTVIAGTEYAESPFYSPDSHWVAYFDTRRLMKVNVRTGSAPVMVCECSGSRNGAVWLMDGTIVFTRPNRGLLKVSAEGGEPVEFTSLNTSPREAAHRSPAPLPGGALLYTSHAADGRFSVIALRPSTGERKVLVESANDANYLSSGHLVFYRNAGIHVAPFDADRLELTGPIVALVDRIGVNPSGGYGGYSVSANGTLAFRPSLSQEGRTLAWVSRNGDESVLPVSPRAFSSPRASPDGTRVAFAATLRDRSDIYTYELSSAKLTQLTSSGSNKAPLWTRDGQRLVYASDRDGTPRLWWEPADGSGIPEPLVSGSHGVFPGSWSADGRTLIYVDDHLVTGSRTYAIDVLGDRKPRAIFPDVVTRAPSLSPDGRWLALTMTDGFLTQVYVTDFPLAKTRRKISTTQGRQPVWRRDGRELVYRSGPRLFAVSVTTDRGMHYSTPTLLFERPYAVANDRAVMGLDYDVGPDGRLLMIKPGPDELRSNRLHIVMNWPEEVKRRAASAR